MQARHGCEPVILTLHDEHLEADGAAAPLCASLNGIAERLHAKFMCSRDLDAALAAAPSVQSGARQGDAGSILEVTRHPTGECHRWWGIND